ncbi:hypothetical protein B0T16DRAFT_342123 [Cercophora newfieldiana]|uniref:DNA repair protein REV1 n=1 Tax=Cercophora newfieldiana TaxID=92897 RepID=A0AA39YNM1_9PEZI|nr:hypothetical protein B0T16DRAFT_342123 [Cercophora newfieldiana]
MGSRLEKGSAAVRKRLEAHTFTDETGEEYEGSEFGGFGDYFRRKKIKLQNLDVELRAAAGDKPQIFKGVVAHVTGYTQPSLQVLHKELVQHGADFLQYLDSKTMATHIIASAMPPKKAAEFAQYRVVKPAWVTDSIQAGRLLPWTDYRAIDDGRGSRQKTIKFDGGKMFSQATKQSPQGYREQTQNSFYTSQFQRSSSALNPHGSSSLFQPTSATKLPGKIEDIDEMDVERPTPSKPPNPVLSAATDEELYDTEDPAGAPEGPEMDHTVNSEEMPGPVESATSDSPSKPKVLTSEEHNALLLSDPKIRKSSTANPEFLKQFYSESRLHHLSTWKAQLKARLQTMAAQKGPSVKATKRKGSRRYVMHVDFDSFFCAVSLKSAPDYRDKPAAVAHSTGSGSEIASCNYPARKFGVKNGMWMKRAIELCPDLKVLPYDFPGYEEASQLFYEAILDVGGVVQSVSIDEALIDITDIVLSATGSEGVGVSEGSIWREQEKADEMASQLRQQIKAKTDCHISIGIGGNILLAKIALRKAKPAGQYQIKPEEVLDLLGELKVEDLPGVAYSIGGKLEEIGVKLVKDIRQTSKERLVTVLGPKTGEKLWEYARGIDRAEVGEQPIRKSVSADVNWGIRFISQEEAEEFVRNLSKELEKRLLNEGVRGKHLTMKIMRRSLDAPLDPAKHLGHGKCDTFNKSVTFGVATHDGEAIGKEAVAILRSYKFSPGDLRGLGVQMTKLEPLKASTRPEGSQKKLSFTSFTSAPLPRRQKSESEPIDEGEGPTGEKSAKSVDEDPITVDPLTPRKPKVHPALALSRTNAADEKARTPLNIGGTQFIMPTNPDAGVLVELPNDIRSKLLGPAQRTSAAQSRQTSPSLSRSQSPALTDDIPPDIDPEVFNYLPEEMKADALASYGLKRRPGGQTRLPQSPRKDRIIQHPKEKSTPTKRGIKAAFPRIRERERKHDTEAGLLQTSFVTDGSAAEAEDSSHDDTDMMSELDADSLAKLPEDMRREIVNEHRKQRLVQKSGLAFNRPRRRYEDTDDILPGSQLKISFPAAPPKVSFSDSGLTATKDVQRMVKKWYDETQQKGPHKRDVDVFEKYLHSVIEEERDMEKVRKLMKWLQWIIDEDADGLGKQGWTTAMDSLKAAVQEAMKARGLGPMDFS